MPLSHASYDHDTASLLTDVLERACVELGIADDDLTGRKIIGLRVMAAACKGERCPDRLREAVVEIRPLGDDSPIQK